MALNEALLLDFDAEMANTRRTLERAPVEKPDWKPHEKSMPLGRLARHVAELPGWAAMIINTDSLDIAPPGAPPYQPPPPASSREELLGLFEKSVAEARAAIAAASDEHLRATWSFLFGGKTVFSTPRLSVVRITVLNHLIHHRAQLGVYLRLNGIPVPALYGPSADEGRM
ncbi:MAG: DinB family protein [Terriglobia bacterium]